MLLFSIVIGFMLAPFAYIYYIGLRVTHILMDQLLLKILFYIFYTLTFIPLFPIYIIFFVNFVMKKTKELKKLAKDKNIKIDDFLVEYEKFDWILNVSDRQTLLDKAFYVRNSK